MSCGSGGSTSRLAKAAGAKPSGEMRDEKLHAVVVRSRFRNQNGKNPTCSDHFWMFNRHFVWHAQGILHLASREQNVRVLSDFQKRWHTWDI